MGNEFFDDLARETGNELAQLVSKGVIGGDVDSYIDTGSYMLNALLSGSIYKGAPGNKTTTFAGEEATGKTFFLLGIIRQFLDDNLNGGVMYFESEAAVSKQMIEDRGIDSKRMHCIPVSTLQEFRFQALKILGKYVEAKPADRPPMIICLDSLGMLSTTKEMEDTAEGKETKDMTRAQIAKATFRVLALKLGKAKVPLFVTNHTYAVIGNMFPTREMGGGCLVSGTKIKTSHGDIEIQNLQIGDKVDTLFGEKCVTNTFKFTDKDVYEIEMTDGTCVKCSAEHKFLIESDDGYTWIAAKDLSEGVDLVGIMVKTVRCIKRIEQEPVYDVSVDEAHHYILDNGLVTHNSGLKYSADTIIFLSRRKEKEGTEVIGNIIHCKNHKSRLTKENAMIDVLLRYDTGLNRHYGLIDLGLKYNIFNKSGNRIELSDGSKIYEKQIYAKAEKYFTKEILDQLDKAAQLEFSYGNSVEEEENGNEI